MQYSRTNLPPADLFIEFKSGSAEGNCVEIAHHHDGVQEWTAVRDSKTGAVQVYDAGEWNAFKTAIINGTLI